MRISARGLLVITVFLCVVSTAAGAPATHDKAGADKAKSDKNLYDQVELFADALSMAKSDYVEEVDSKKLIYGAMKGMMSSLDDYSQFMDPDEYKEIQVETKGEFGGVGIEISLREGVLTIITPLAGTPAEEAGLKPNDKIVKIDGKSTRDMTLNDSVKLMRGKPGTMLTLTIWREGAQNIFDVPIKRDIVKVHSIKEAEFISDKTGYIKLIEFQENTTQDLDAALKKLESQGMDSLILDLRNNPGGLLEGAVDVAERFLAKDQTIVSIKARDPAQGAVFKSTGRFVRPGYPLIVMVNDGSASASEIVAAAVKDNRRGITLGTKTFGKASVQTVLPLKDGSALRLTTALYLTPSGKLIKDEGITPDIVVEKVTPGQKKAPEDIFEKLDEKTDKVVKTDHEQDNQLDAAVTLIKAIKIYRQEGK